MVSSKYITELKTDAICTEGYYSAFVANYTNNWANSSEKLQQLNVAGWYPNWSMGMMPWWVRENIVYSVIDASISKLSLFQVGINVLPVNASPKIANFVPKIQRFAIGLFHNNGVFANSLNVARDCLGLGTGALLVNPDGTCEWIPVDQIYYNPNDARDRNPTIVMRKRKIPNRKLKKIINVKDELKAMDDMTTLDEVWDITEKKHFFIINNKIVKEEPFNSDRLPIVLMHCTPPFYGMKGYGYYDVLGTLQNEIDFIYTRIHRSFDAWGTPRGIIQENISKANMAINDPYTFITVETQLDSEKSINNQFAVLTPNWVQAETFQYLEKIKSSAYELVGLNMQAVAGEIPKAMSSGAAQRQYQVSADNRFNALRLRFQDFFVEV